METPFIYDANLLCLDLVNTAVVLDGKPVDLLTDFAALIGWLRGARLLSDSDAAEVEGWTGTRKGEKALDAARELRGAVKRIADDLIASAPVDGRAVEVLNRVLAGRPAVHQVARYGDGFRRITRSISHGPSSLITPVAESAAELLAELDCTRVGRCDGPECVLYFYDTSKNRSRRWCSMERCGNRAKLARHYIRSRGAGEAADP